MRKDFNNEEIWKFGNLEIKFSHFLNCPIPGLIYHLCLLVILIGCGGGGETPPDTRDKGVIHISADESFKPVIDSQIQVYESSYPETRIIAHYKTEAECLQDFLNDTIRMVIATRSFSKGEEDAIIDSLKLIPKKMRVAYDAIAVIVSPQSADSLFTMEEIKQILKGTFRKPLIPVFDGLRATSTVRFIIDSVLRRDTLTRNAVGAKSSEEVINYVSTHPGAIGFIGVNWIGNPEDTMQTSFLKKVKIAHIESTDIPGAYVQPYQANMYTKRYPLVRELFYTLKEEHRGLGHGFAHFLSSERGQLIFRRAYLVPALSSFYIRNANMRE